MDRKGGNFTLAFENQLTGEMIKTFMACQVCKHVNTKNKLLKCTHTICQKCALAIRRRQKKAGHWVIECLICRTLTYCYGDNMEGLKDNTTVQKLVEKASSKRNYSPTSSRYGQTSTHNADLSINVVTSSKEKQEIQKVLESAQRRVLVCQEQAKQVKSYERKVKTAKAKIENQIKESVETYISAIRTQEDQLLEELDMMFQEEFHPVKEANECIEMQMQSFKLVKQCCSVAGRILKGGGAAMDMNSFKQMVKQSMHKMNSQELPAAIQKTFKPKVFYTSNEVEYEELAERIGHLSLRKERKKEGKRYSRRGEMEQLNLLKEDGEEPHPMINEHFVMREVQRAEPQNFPEKHQVRKEVEEEPIYDLPPDWEEIQHLAQSQRYDRGNEDTYGFGDEGRYGCRNEERYERGDDNGDREEECYYDVIPFRSETQAEIEFEGDSDVYESDGSAPEPVKKDYVTHQMLNEQQVEPEASVLITDNDLSIITKRRQAVGGSDTEWEDTQSADELYED